MSCKTVRESWADLEESEEQLERRGIVELENGGECFVCGEHTMFADIDYQGWLCSPRCQRQANKDAAATSKKTV